jgi:hypothetical protein
MENAMPRLDELLGIITFATVGMIGAIVLQPASGDPTAAPPAPVVAVTAQSTPEPIGKP